MTDTNATETAGSKAPSHIAYHVRERNGGKAIFTPIGAVWPHKKGGGFNIQFHIIPPDRQVVVLPAKEKKN